MNNGIDMEGARSAGAKRRGGILAVMVALALLTVLAGGCGDDRETVWTGAVTDYNTTSTVDNTRK
jgi:hypothetical protein